MSILCLLFLGLCDEIPVDWLNRAAKLTVHHFGLLVSVLNHFFDEVLWSMYLIRGKLLWYAFDIPLYEINFFFGEEVLGFLFLVFSEISVEVIRVALFEKTLFLPLFYVIEHNFFRFRCMFFRLDDDIHDVSFICIPGSNLFLFNLWLCGCFWVNHHHLFYNR